MGKSWKIIIVLCLILLSTVAFAEKSYFIWTTFSSGELSPFLDGQVNFDKYFTGVKKLENFLVRPQGPVSNRPGFKYIAGTKTNTAKSRLVPFIFSDTQAYALEFGDQYIRFFRDGGQITSIDSQTTLLLSMNGNDASTTFTDSSASPHSMTAGNNAQVDTAQKKFGTGSLLLDGAGDFLTTPDHADFDLSASDGGIDLWVRPTVGNSGIYTIFRQDVNADSEIFMRAYLDKYTGLLLNGNKAPFFGLLLDNSLNTKLLISTNGVEMDTSDPKFGIGALKFDGTNYLSGTGNADFDIGSGTTGTSDIFTIDMFIKPDSVSGTQYLVDFTNGSGQGVQIFLDGSTLTAKLISTLTTHTFTHSTAVDTGSQYIAFVGDGGIANLYLDTVEAGKQTLTGSMPDMSSVDLFIGTDKSGTNGYSGLIDDFALTKNEVYDVDTATLTVPTVENKKIAYPVWEIGETTPTTQKAKFETDCITAESFHHVEANWDTSENKLYLFCDGQLRSGGAVTFTGANADPSGSLDSVFSIGTDPDGSTLPFKGWMDELRWSLGSLRHTADFVPPISEYTLLGSTPLEITTNVSYLEADLFELQFAQSADTLYIAHKDYPTKKLLRITDTTWRLVDIEFLPPPLQPESQDKSVALTLGQKTVGIGVTVTPASEIFITGDVGKEIREDSSVGDGRAIIVAHQAGPNPDTVTVDIFVEFSGTSVGSGTWDLVGTNSTGTLTITGNINSGTFQVAVGEVLTLTSSLDIFAGDSTDVGKFITTDDGTGSAVYKIVSNAGSSTTIVESAVLNATTYTTNQVMIAGEWEIKKSVWTTNDYPSAVTFFENRLLLAGSPSFPETIWGSAVDDYENHNLGSANDADAYAFTLAGRQVNKIQWLDSSDVLLVGTIGAEWVLGTKGSSSPTTPSNVLARLQTGYGSDPVQSVNIGQSILYLQKGGEKVREMIFDFDTDKHNSPDLSILAEHITEGGIVEMDYQDDPISTGWFVRNDGVLLSMTLLREQEVVGWARHITDGSFESIAVIPGSDGDELWAIVNRTIESATKRYVEKMNPVYDDTTLDSDTAFFVDSGLLYTGVSTTSITGLDHLDGETVSVLGDGVVLGDEVVSSGAITIDTASSRVIVGLPYTSTLQTMRIESKDGKGTAQGRKKRFNRVVFRVDKTKQFQYGQTPTGTLKTYTFDSLYSGDQEVDFIMGNTREGYVTVVNSEPLPITILAIIPEMNLSD